MATMKSVGLIISAVSLGLSQPVPHTSPDLGKLQFETASVRLASDAKQPGEITYLGLRGGPGTADPTRISGRVDLRAALLRAFHVQGDQMFGPSWMQDLRFNLSAVIAPGTTEEEANVMLQNLLLERFGITLHHETRKVSVYELTIAKQGVKMRPSAVHAAPAAGDAGRPVDPAAIRASLVEYPATYDAEGYGDLPEGDQPAQRAVDFEDHELLNARGQSLEAITRTLQKRLRLARVIDRTGLSGTYDFKLKFGFGPPPSAAGPNDTSPVPPDAPFPDLFQAIEQQLGLRLTASSELIDVIVIDHINRTPTDN